MAGKAVHDEKRALWYLKKIPLLADLAHETLTHLAQKVQLVEVRRRQVVYLPGDPGHTLYFVNSGRVKISKVTRDGKELTLAYRGLGEVFGELSLIDGGPREEMAEAVENTVITEIDRVEFEALLEAERSIGYRLTKVFAQRRRDVENKIENLVFKDVNAKLAQLLLRLATEYGVDDARGTLVALKITHQEMANLIGSTRETVSLTLSHFKRKGLIQTDGRKVILADSEGLRALADSHRADAPHARDSSPMKPLPLLLVGIGGFAGAIARFAINTAVGTRLGTHWPWATFIINISGCFAIGFFFAFAGERAGLSENWRFLFPIGFVGAYTTFSTYSYETLRMVEDGAWPRALAYVLLSTVLGFAAVAAASALGRRF